SVRARHSDYFIGILGHEVTHNFLSYAINPLIDEFAAEAGGITIHYLRNRHDVLQKALGNLEFQVYAGNRNNPLDFTGTLGVATKARAQLLWIIEAFQEKSDSIDWNKFYKLTVHLAREQPDLTFRNFIIKLMASYLQKTGRSNISWEEIDLLLSAEASVDMLTPKELNLIINADKKEKGSSPLENNFEIIGTENRENRGQRLISLWKDLGLSQSGAVGGSSSPLGGLAKKALPFMVAAVCEFFGPSLVFADKINNSVRSMSQEENTNPWSSSEEVIRLINMKILKIFPNAAIVRDRNGYIKEIYILGASDMVTEAYRKEEEKFVLADIKESAAQKAQDFIDHISNLEKLCLNYDQNTDDVLDSCGRGRLYRFAEDCRVILDSRAADEERDGTLAFADLPDADISAVYIIDNLKRTISFVENKLNALRPDYPGIRDPGFWLFYVAEQCYVEVILNGYYKGIVPDKFIFSPADCVWLEDAGRVFLRWFLELMYSLPQDGESHNSEASEDYFHPNKPGFAPEVKVVSHVVGLSAQKAFKMIKQIVDDCVKNADKSDSVPSKGSSPLGKREKRPQCPHGEENRTVPIHFGISNAAYNHFHKASSALTREKVLEELEKRAEYILSLESVMKKLTNKEIAGKRGEYERRLKQKETIDDILPKAFALAREAFYRVSGKRLYKEQIMGSLGLHYRLNNEAWYKGNVVELKTGEGKTFISILKAYLDILAGWKVHIITQNEYLSKRDYLLTRKAYKILGLSVGVVKKIKSPMPLLFRVAGLSGIFIAIGIAFQVFYYDSFFLGMSLLVLVLPACLLGGILIAIAPNMSHILPPDYESWRKKQAYESDIVFTTINTGYDYVYDKYEVAAAGKKLLPPLEKVSAIVDEVDDLLLDQLGTELRRVGVKKGNIAVRYYYQTINAIALKLEPKSDFSVKADKGTIELTASGKEKIITFYRSYQEKFRSKKIRLNLRDYLAEVMERISNPQADFKDGIFSRNISVELEDRDGEILFRDVIASIRAYKYQEGIHYLVRAENGGKNAGNELFNGQGNKKQEVVLVDESTGRLKPGYRLRNFHTALEAKHGITPLQERELFGLALPQYFKAYGKLAGMTGTAGNQASHWIFHNLYGLETIAIPTHRLIIRKDIKPKIFKDEESKLSALIDKIIELNRKGQPVLVGTASILESELISGLLKQKAPGIKHQVLNAKFHEREARIIKKAGRRGVVTIATNMAGRGTDIALGKGVKELGGLSVIGLSPNLSRRIDDQLKGRAGRQGDPGISQIYVAQSWFGEDIGSECLEALTFNPDGSIEEDTVAYERLVDLLIKLQYQGELSKYKSAIARNMVNVICEFQDEILGLAKLFEGLNIFEALIISQVSKLLDVRKALISFKEKRGEYALLNGEIDSPESYFKMKQWLLDEFEPLLNLLVLNIEKVNSIRKINLPFADTKALQKTWGEYKNKITELEKIFNDPYFKSSASPLTDKAARALGEKGVVLGIRCKSFADTLILEKLPITMIELNEFPKGERLVIPQGNDFVGIEDNFTKLKEFIEKKQLALQAHFPFRFDGEDREISIGNPEDRDRIMRYLRCWEFMRKKFSLSKELIFTLHPPSGKRADLKERIDPDVLLFNANTLLVQLDDTIEKEKWGIKIGVENLPDSLNDYWFLGNQIEHFKRMLANTKKHIHITFDSGHSLLTRGSLNLNTLYEFAKEQGKEFITIHFHKNEGFWRAGTGNLMELDQHRFPTPRGMPIFDECIRLAVKDKVPLTLEIDISKYTIPALSTLINGLWKKLEACDSSSPLEENDSGLVSAKNRAISIFVISSSPAREDAFLDKQIDALASIVGKVLEDAPKSKLSWINRFKLRAATSDFGKMKLKKIVKASLLYECPKRQKKAIYKLGKMGKLASGLIFEALTGYKKEAAYRVVDEVVK
ncbi:MAG: hypothetical protein A2Y00_10315, partial [Omnitrophica WOR_2 bacterium GWF2_43_52]